MKVSIISTILLLNLRLFEALVSSSDVIIRLFPGEYDEMIASESFTELSALPLNKRKITWNRKTRRYFRKGKMCVDSSKPCLTPFIICDSTPDRSGEKRRNRIRNKMLQRTPPKKRDLVKISNIPFYNTDERTCFYASVPPTVGRKLAVKSCGSVEKNCLVHSLIPMMKVSAGCVSDVTSQVQFSGTTLTIYTELSPYFKEQSATINLISLSHEIVESTKVEEDSMYQTEDTFPKTSSSISYSVNNFDVKSELITSSTLAFYITLPANSTSSKDDRDTILKFVAGLAVRPEVVSIAITDAYYNYY